MDIDEAIKILKQLGDHFGYTTELKFDCPYCQRTTEPNRIVAVKSVVLRGAKE